METYQIAIIFLYKQGFDLYIPTLQTPLRFGFSPDTVIDMEIINTEKFITQITTFLTTYNIPASDVVILISQTLLFTKDIQTIIPSQDPSIPPQQLSDVEQQKTTQDFLETIPFEIVESKTIPIDGGIRIVATNKTLYDSIRIAFEKAGSTVKLVLPAFMLGTSNAGEGLTDEVITTVITNLESLKQQTLLIRPPEVVQQTPEEKKKEFLSLPKKQTKLYVYAGIFVVLIGFLAFLFVQTNAANDADLKKAEELKKEAAAKSASAAAATPTPTTNQTIPVAPTQTSGAIDKSLVRIEIEVSPATTTQGNLIKNKLLSNGYTTITVNSNAPTATAKTLVIFSSTINSTVQQEVSNIVSNIFTNFSSQQSTQTQFDITIIPSANL